MNEFRVPKERASVLVTIPPRPPTEMFLFLSPFSQSHQGPETPADLFNEPEPFIPLFRDSGEVALARRDTIAWVQVADPRRWERHYYETRTGAPEARVRLEFDGGSILEGAIALLAPSGSRRVADVMNRLEGFLHLERGDDLFLVNPRRVTLVTVKEEDRGGAR